MKQVWKPKPESPRLEGRLDPLAVRDRGRGEAKVSPGREPTNHVGKLRGAVVVFYRPCDPIDVDAWEALH